MANTGITGMESSSSVSASDLDGRDWIMQYPFGWIEMWLSTTPVVAAGMVSFVLANLFYTA
jgi:hypothetical protein